MAQQLGVHSAPAENQSAVLTALLAQLPTACNPSSLRLHKHLHACAHTPMKTSAGMECEAQPSIPYPEKLPCPCGQRPELL